MLQRREPFWQRRRKLAWRRVRELGCGAPEQPPGIADAAAVARLALDFGEHVFGFADRGEHRPWELVVGNEEGQRRGSGRTCSRAVTKEGLVPEQAAEQQRQPVSPSVRRNAPAESRRIVMSARSRDRPSTRNRHPSVAVHRRVDDARGQGRSFLHPAQERVRRSHHALPGPHLLTCDVQALPQLRGDRLARPRALSHAASTDTTIELGKAESW